MMREVGLSVFAMCVAGGWYLFSGNAAADNIYTLSVAEAQSRLARSPMPQHYSPFGDMAYDVSKPTANQVRWTARGAHAAVICEANIELVEADQVRVRSSCAGGGLSEGAAAGTGNDIKQIEFTEFVDSALEGRAFDQEKIKVAVTATMAKNYPSMIKNALQMDLEMHKMKYEQEKQKAAASSVAATAPAAAPPPTTDLTIGDVGSAPGKFGEPTAMGQPTGFGEPSQ
jgi:hypothetical protein